MEDRKKPAGARSEQKKEGDLDFSRRNFLKIFGAGGAAALLVSDPAHAAGALAASKKEEPKGVLVDTTLCIGCRQCEQACNFVNKLPKPKHSFDDDSVLNEHRDTSPREWSVVNRYTMKNGVQITRKQQCMNCVEPACSSACIIRAMRKRPDGAVTYREDLCLGCRYCMVACPFDMPKFEYNSPVPRVRKCQFCYSRQEKGEQPGCVEACPVGALTFGVRSELLEEARKRIRGNPKNYIDHIYGEREAGGTSWLYLANAPFDQLGLPKLSGQNYPELTSGAEGTVPAVLLIWPALLSGFHYFSHRKDEVEKERSRHETSHRGIEK